MYFDHVIPFLNTFQVFSTFYPRNFVLSFSVKKKKTEPQNKPLHMRIKTNKQKTNKTNVFQNKTK